MYARGPPHAHVTTITRMYSIYHMYIHTYVAMQAYVNSYRFNCFLSHIESKDSFEKENYFATPDEASKEFEAVLGNIAEELKNCNKVDLEKISYHLTNGQGVPLLSQEAKDRVTASKTISDIFIVMQAYWNWCSHRLLLDIINVVNSPKAQEMLEKFEKKINNTMKLKIIYSKFEESQLPVPQGYRKMTAIVDKDYSEITLQEWSEIELTIFQCLGLLQPPSEINDSQYVEVVWYVCTEAVDSLKSKALQHKDLRSFLFLQVDDVVIFNYTRKPPLSEVCAFIMCVIILYKVLTMVYLLKTACMPPFVSKFASTIHS